MKYYFPIHLDGGNRGCEAIAKSTAIILGESPSNLIGLCSNVELDQRLGLNRYYTLQKKKKLGLFYYKIRKLLNFIIKLLGKDDYLKNVLGYRIQYKIFLNQAASGSYMISTGGDMLCYSDNEIIYTQRIAARKGLKTILWGCSIGNENLTYRKIEIIKNFDAIFVRESLSYHVLKELGVKNLILCPDPAFILKPEVTELPETFNKPVIGINISGYVLKGGFDYGLGKALTILIDFILHETNYSILLIPHVMWTSQDDRKAIHYLKSIYKNEDRICILEGDKYNYCELRFIISKCHIFIGARTHSIISAYSCCVPAIALGYSIKSKGIARDLALPDYMVIDSRDDIESNTLLDSFKKVEINYPNIQSHLIDIMPAYISQLENLRIIL